MQKLNDIPKSIQNEKNIIACIFQEGKRITEVSSKLEEKDFWDRENKRIYRALLWMNKADIHITTASIMDRIGLKGSQVAEYLNQPYTGVELDRYIKEVKTASNLRKLIYVGAEIKSLGQTQDKDISELLEKSNELLGEIKADENKRMFGMMEMLDNALQRIDERVKNKGKGLIGVPSGFYDLDKILHGFRKGGLYILAARPGQGKTSLVMDIARQAAEKNKKITMFSLEQSFEELIDKMICSKAGINLWKFQSGYINDEDTDSYSSAMSELFKLKIQIDDTAGIAPSHIRSTLNRLQDIERPDMIIVDYLQLMRAGHKTSGQVEAVSYISRELKAIAKEYEVPVIALSQLSRGIEQRGDKEPRLSDLRDSGSIEQDADVVMFLQRDDDEEYGNSELIIAKHRAGPTGVVELLFDKGPTSFKNKN